MDDYGILVLCPDNLSEYKHVLSDEGIALHKDCSNSWDTILCNKLLPCNSMIIVDNYVLNDINLMKENLGQIVNALKPQILRMKIPFYISIFTTLRNDKNIDLPVDVRWKILHDDIIRDLDVRISIIKSQEDFHDRTILTNNQFIGCGYGFSLFKNKKSRKTTTISVVCPFLNHSVKWAFDGYNNVITDASIPYFAEDLNKYGDNITYCYPKFYVGHKFNRLLDKL